MVCHLFSSFIFIYSRQSRKKIFSKSHFKRIYRTMENMRHYSIIMRFLIARMFYLDGLTTLFIFGGVYAAVVFNMSEFEILSFAIAVNLSSGIGAFALAYLDDRIGSKNLIMISIG